MLPFVALFLVVLMSVATLAVDLGLVSFSQAAMQVAADGAATEGLRLRDDIAGDPVASDLRRRDAAATLVQRLEDDDLLSTPDDAIGLGAGPDLELLAGGPVPGSSSLLVVGAAPLWKPQLQANAENLVHGDLVAGTYDPSAPHVEADDYERPDFAVAGTADAPGAPAFLARLRRTNDAFGLDAMDGVSSRGPPLPLLFGQGAFLHGDERGDYDPRVDGFTVRATAIASSRAAIAVGPALASAPGQGAVAWSLHRNVWEAQPVEVPLVLVVDMATGALSLPGGEEVGTACELLLSAGAAVVASVPGALPADGWIAVTSDAIDGSPRTVGFGIATLSPAGPNGVTIVKHASRVAPLNASCVAAGLLPALDAAELQQLFDLVASLPLDASGGYVLAPALVR